ncbi:hypothetical protein CROQUDRAFT_651362 [Cronartium quercuum f. sp. fusiforme G11]|uniref:Uncharacterized protein n=1 Tax=Cronartium quercuum f. sp. fusiforme G11 TaxID=708437 RepID=A0A9P6TG74_9BASI|nr:hypothetical protein CROQUDRAFT_651362 [Cronartium quercuum f. sp. fusiforme G11]
MGGPHSQAMYRDPWQQREAWRRHPIFSRREQFKNLFPGFGIALVAFSGYVVWDKLSSPDSNTIQHLKKQTAKEIEKKGQLASLLNGSEDKKE